MLPVMGTSLLPKAGKKPGSSFFATQGVSTSLYKNENVEKRTLVHITQSHSWLLPREWIYYQGTTAATGSPSPTVQVHCRPWCWVAPDLPAASLPSGGPAAAVLGFIPSGNLDGTLAWRSCSVGCRGTSSCWHSSLTSPFTGAPRADSF